MQSTQARSRLSKSRFLAGQQCSLRLWNEVYRRKLADSPNEAQEAIFEIGHEVGELARRRWPDGTLVGGEPWEIDAAIEETYQLLGDPTVPSIYEAAIMHRRVLTRVDVLVRVGDGSWDLVEVKSGTRVKEPFQTDVALQYWVLRGAGFRIRSAGLLVLNRDYIYEGGRYDLDRLFRFEDLTDACEARLDEVSDRVDVFQDMLASGSAPNVGIGEHCHSPYECPFWNSCTKGMEFPANPVSMLPRLMPRDREAFAARGIETLEDIPRDYGLTPLQETVRQSALTGVEWVSPELTQALEEVDWPLHFLDFEAVQLPLPRYPGTRPWEAIAFQFSCHQQASPGVGVRHCEFLATDDADPRRALAQHLLDTVEQQGSIVVYSGYERRTIRALAAALPDLSERLLALESRLVDLLAIMRGHYYHPDFAGSYSIKNVLPVLVPSMTYEGMEVVDGQAAGRAWLQMVSTEDSSERERLERGLRDYCAQDSRAMFELREALLLRQPSTPAMG